MFFVVSKAMEIALTPSSFLVACVLLGGGLTRTRWARAGRRLTLAGAVLLAAFGLSPAANWLAFPLEQRFPAWEAAGAPPVGAVVLGGAVDPSFHVRGVSSLLNGAAERVTSVVALARRYPEMRFILAGGNARLLPNDEPTEAAMMAAVLVALGVPPERLIVEERSRTTAENATFAKATATAAALPRGRWLLLTSALHMPRAMASFRHAGFAIEPYPVDFRTRGPGDLLRPFRSAAEGLKLTDSAVHEWLGLIGYRLTGRSGALLPRP
jgi:uncharacterized SAM-binding protein YcdF (DUF218 family)